MDDSILITIKKMLGIDGEYDAFDTDVLININTVLMTLSQLGIGPEGGFFISDSSAVWSDLLEDSMNLEAVKTYIYLKVKMLFDPPSNSFLMDAMKNQAEELGWRLNVQAESEKKFDFMTEDSLKRGGSPINVGVEESDGG